MRSFLIFLLTAPPAALSPLPLVFVDLAIAWTIQINIDIFVKIKGNTKKPTQ
jgi:hypothetical protein